MSPVPLVALVPPGVVTVTSTVPSEPAGMSAVIWVGDTTVNVVVVAPNFTAVAPESEVPVIVTWPPPASSEEDGDSEVTAGTA